MNGTLVATSQPGNLPDNASPGQVLEIGSDRGATFASGTIDDVRVYNRVLSPPEVTQLDLVGWWMLDDASSGTTPTTAADSTGNGNTATLTGTSGPTWTSSGEIGNALSFVRANTQAANTGTLYGISTTSKTFTVSFWANASDTVAGEVFAIGNYVTCEENYSADTIGCEVDGSNNITASFPHGAWHMGTLVYNGTVPSLYVDGVLKATDVARTANISPAAFYMGNFAGTPYFSGTLDDVRIYDRALSAIEINQIYAHSNPVGWWTFDEGSGTVAHDSSGSGNNMGMVGTVTWTTGILGGAVSIPGTTTTDMETAADETVFDGSSSWTASAWVYINSLADLPSSGSQGTIINHYAQGNASTLPTGETPAWSLAIDNGWHNCTSPQFEFSGSEFDGSGSWDSAGCVGSISAQTWYLVTGEYDNTTGTFYLYVNGVLVNTSSANGAGFMAYSPCTTAADCPVSVGANAENNNLFLKGLVDDARVYNRLLSASEITATYNAGSGIPNGIVGWWKLDDASSGTSPTTAVDSSGNGNTGTLTDSTGPTLPTWTTGMIGNAVKLTVGSQDYINMGDPAILRLAGSFTVSAWVNLNSLPTSGNIASIVDKHTATGWENYEIDVRNTAGVYTWELLFNNNSGTAYTASYTATPGLGTWYLVTGVWDSSTSNEYLYLNGTLVATVNQAGAVPDASSGRYLQIGVQNQTAGKYLDGTVDDVRVYNRALSAAEVGQLYGGASCGPAAPSSNLVGWWKMDDGSGSTFADSSSTANNGTLTGSPLPIWTNGKFSGALNFDSQQNTATTPANATQEFSGPFSASVWLNTTVLIGATADITFVGSFVFPTKGWVLADNDPTSANIYFRVHPSSGGTSCSTGAACFANSLVTDGAWHNIVGVYDGTNVMIYLDGVLKNTQLATGGFTQNTAGYIIAHPGHGTSSSFSLDDIRVYNVALTAVQVATLYNSASPTYHGEGDLMYNSTYNVMQYCNGTNFVRIGSHAP